MREPCKPLMKTKVKRNTEKWKKEFQSQVTKAYQLLKKYHEKAIINALNSYKGKNVYSLRVKWLEDMLARTCPSEFYKGSGKKK